MVHFFVRSSYPVQFPSWKQPLQPCFSWKAHRHCTLNMKGVKVEGREREKKMENPSGEQKWNAQAMCQGGDSLRSGQQRLMLH